MLLTRQDFVDVCKAGGIDTDAKLKALTAPQVAPILLAIGMLKLAAVLGEPVTINVTDTTA